VNVLKMAQDVARKIGVTPPTALFGSTAPISVRMVALLEDQGRYLRERCVWPQQKKFHTITTTASRSKYPFPSDFYAWVPGTTIDQQYADRLVGPLTDSEWNDRVYAEGYESRPAFRVYGPDGNPASSGGQIEIHPTPASNGLTYTFDYLTKNLFYTSNYVTGSETISADTDVSLFDDDIMLKGLEWRYRESKGQQYGEQKAEHDRMVDAAAARWAGTYKGSFANRMNEMKISVPRGGWSL
jgi:hypothetical protein